MYSRHDNFGLFKDSGFLAGVAVVLGFEVAFAAIVLVLTNS